MRGSLSLDNDELLLLTLARFNDSQILHLRTTPVQWLTLSMDSSVV